MDVGPYRIEGELGRGGMGTVYRGRTADGREVAVKILHGRDQKALRSFDRERRLLASVGEAEGFVAFLDAGTSSEGPWIAMPLVRGGSLRERLLRSPPGLEESIEIAETIAAALGRAHAMGVVHRDLKPENVLFNADGRPLVADLGLAKHFRRDAPGGSRSVSLTAADTFKGTIGYAAPEQVNDAKNVGPPTDVFAVGAILFECLAGRPAFSGDQALVVLARVVRGDRESIGRARPDLPEPIVDVVERALAVRAEDRYADGAALAAALGSARTGGAARLRAGASWRRLVVAGSALAVVSAALGAVVLGAGRSDPSPSRGGRPRAETSPTSGSVESDFPPECVGFLATARTRLVAVHGEYLEGHSSGVIAAFVGESRIVTAGLDRSIRLWDRETGRPLGVVGRHEDAITHLATSTDGRLAITAGFDATVRVWDLETRSERHVLRGHQGWSRGVAIDARSGLAASGGHHDATIRIWDLGTGESIQILEGHEASITSTAFSPDGRRLLSASADGTVRLWDVSDGALLRTLTGHEGVVFSATFSPDGIRATSAASDGVRVWDLTDGTPTHVLLGGGSAYRWAAFAPDGRRLAVAGADLDDLDVTIWDAASGERLAVLGGHDFPTRAGAFSSDGRSLLTGGGSASARLWDVERAEKIRDFGGRRAGVRAVAVAPDGSLVLAGDLAGRARLIDTTSLSGEGEVLRDGHAVDVVDVAFSPDGTQALTASFDATARAWDVARRRPVATLAGHEGWVNAVAFSEGGELALTASFDGTIRIWETERWTSLRTLTGHDGPVFTATFVGRGNGVLVASGGRDGSLRIWKPGSGEERFTLEGPRPLVSVASVPGTWQVVSGSSLGRVRAVATRIGTERRVLIEPENIQAWTVAVRPDGGRAAVAFADGSLRLISLPKGQELDRIDLRGAADVPLSVAFTPAGDGLVVGTERGLVLRFDIDR